MNKAVLIILFLCIFPGLIFANYIFIPMDDVQTEHLKAYGIMYYALSIGLEGYWILNYRGGSFLIPYNKSVEEKCLERNVYYEEVDEGWFENLKVVVSKENMNIVKLTKAPRIGVYAPEWYEPWDDAVMLVLEYAKIPYTKFYDTEVIKENILEKGNFDWIHLHHEDFTAQYGKFLAMYGTATWYINRVNESIKLASSLGFRSYAELKKEVALRIRKFVERGGFLFAMCSATDTLDIALASIGIDIIPPEIDGTPITPNAQELLNYKNTFAFQNFKLIFNPYIYEYSDIDVDPNILINREPKTFRLLEFSAKVNISASILTQNHRRVIKDFLGQTSAFKKDLLKPDVMILGDYADIPYAKYIRGDLGEGAWAFLAGHDPEDFTHYVEDPPTDLSLFPNSPGYRLILNNVLFPATEKKRKKT